jgi:WD40 repeat protein
MFRPIFRCKPSQISHARAPRASQAFAGAVLCVAFLPYGPFLCVGAVDKTTKVFHVLTGEIQFSLSAHSLAVRRMSISTDGIIATASDDKEIRLWDVRMPWTDAMGTQLAVCKGHTEPITCCHLTKEGKVSIFSPHGSRLFRAVFRVQGAGFRRFLASRRSRLFRAVFA